MTAVVAQARRGFQLSRAFLRMGMLYDFSYPMAFALGQMQAIVPVAIYFFVAKLVQADSNANVAYDYFTYAMIGVVWNRVLLAAVQGFGQEMDDAIQQGRLEMMLMEPVRWTLLPMGIAQWPVLQRLVIGILAMLVTVAMGANYVFAGIPMLALMLFLGIASSLAIGVLATSVKVLAKRSDPVLTIYALAVQVLSGVFFPIELLPKVMRWMAWLVPQTYAIIGIRRVMMPQGSALPGPSTWQIIAALTAFCAIVFPLAFASLSRTMRYGRRLGVLTGY